MEGGKQKKRTAEARNHYLSLDYWREKKEKKPKKKGGGGRVKAR